MEGAVPYEMATSLVVKHPVDPFTMEYLKLYGPTPSNPVISVVGLPGLTMVAVLEVVCDHVPVSPGNKVEFPTKTNDVVPLHTGIAGAPWMLALAVVGAPTGDGTVILVVANPVAQGPDMVHLKV